MSNGLPAQISVLLGDDHPVVRAGYAASLSAFGINVSACVGSVAEVVTAFEEHRPDVVVLDIRFGESLSGFDAAADLLNKWPDAKIVFLSQFSQDSIVKRAYQIGGKSFVTKDCEVDILAKAITNASAGQVYFLPVVAERLASLSITGEQSPDALLQSRDLEIFKLMAKGLTIVEIAERMQLSVKTISNTSQSIKDRLGIHRPAEITRLAIRYGLIEA